MLCKTAKFSPKIQLSRLGEICRKPNQNFSLIISLKRDMARLGENALDQNSTFSPARDFFLIFLSRSSRLSEILSLEREIPLKWGQGLNSLSFLSPKPSLTFSLSHSGRTFTHSFLCILTHNSLPPFANSTPKVSSTSHSLQFHQA